MSDRPRQPDRAGRFADASPTDPTRDAPPVTHHPAEPPPVDQAAPASLTLRDLILSLPRRPGPDSAPDPASVPDGVSGVATPTYDDPPADERRAKHAEESGASDLPPPASDRAHSLREGRDDGPTPVRADLGGGNRRDEVVPLLAAPPNPGGPGAELPGYPAFSRSVAADVEAPPSRDRVDRSQGEYATAAVSPMGGIAAAVEAPTGLGRWASTQDRSTEGGPGGDTFPTGSTVDVVAIGPVGPAVRTEDPFDRGTSQAIVTTPWGGPSGDSFAGRPEASSPAGEGAPGVDLGPTNALLGQILDELRRQQQAPIASGRSVYPER